MAFNSNVPRAEYIAATGQTVFPFVFKIFEQTDVKVYLTPNGQISDDFTDLLQSGYTVSVNGDAGGSVTLSSATTTGDKITLLRSLPVVRNTDYQENGDLRASTLDSDQDYQTYLVGDLSSKVDKSLALPESAQGVSGTLPSPAPHNYIRWNATATAFENIDSVDITNISNNLDNITVVANNTPNINTVANDISNVNTVANAINNNTGIGGSGSGGGQLLGASIIKGVQYMSSVSAPNEIITVTSGLNAFSVDSFTLASGASIVVEDNATYKVL